MGENDLRTRISFNYIYKICVIIGMITLTVTVLSACSSKKDSIIAEEIKCGVPFLSSDIFGMIKHEGVFYSLKDKIDTIPDSAQYIGELHMLGNEEQYDELSINCDYDVSGVAYEDATDETLIYATLCTDGVSENFVFELDELFIEPQGYAKYINAHIIKDTSGIGVQIQNVSDIPIIVSEYAEPVLYKKEADGWVAIECDKEYSPNESTKLIRVEKKDKKDIYIPGSYALECLEPGEYYFEVNVAVDNRFQIISFFVTID